eukprot:TRINITY_DN22599_c0_g1_i1.p1 TRINITY_DN22599_c0_g1~~TRINITY_DN22599_c0_g1_i1.p1  ORF type:complete len:823 (-),score=148.06 TRINITY_DN22599_c0_g1_i1:185-2653(-)
MSGTGRKMGVCAACRRPLEGNLVASRCNHVFHRDCLKAVGAQECPKCNAPRPCEDVLDLFGVSFGEGVQNGASKNSGDEVDSAEKLVQEIVQIMAQVRTRRKDLEVTGSKLDKVIEVAARAEQKHLEVKKMAAKRSEESQMHAKELEKLKAQHEALCEQVQQTRQRDAALEYRDILQTRGEPEALDYLTKMATFLSDPSMLLTEIARLRDYHRKQLARWQRDCVTVSQREIRTRREFAEREQSVNDLKKKIQRLGGSHASFRTGSQESVDTSMSQDSTSSGGQGRALRRNNSNGSNININSNGAGGGHINRPPLRSLQSQQKLQPPESLQPQQDQQRVPLAVLGNTTQAQHSGTPPCHSLLASKRSEVQTRPPEEVVRSPCMATQLDVEQTPSEKRDRDNMLSGLSSPVSKRARMVARTEGTSKHVASAEPTVDDDQHPPYQHNRGDMHHNPSSPAAQRERAQARQVDADQRPPIRVCGDPRQESYENFDRDATQVGSSSSCAQFARVAVQADVTEEQPPCTDRQSSQDRREQSQEHASNTIPPPEPSSVTEKGKRSSDDTLVGEQELPEQQAEVDVSLGDMSRANDRRLQAQRNEVVEQPSTLLEGSEAGRETLQRDDSDNRIVDRSSFAEPRARTLMEQPSAQVQDCVEQETFGEVERRPSMEVVDEGRRERSVVNSTTTPIDSTSDRMQSANSGMREESDHGRSTEVLREREQMTTEQDSSCFNGTLLDVIGQDEQEPAEQESRHGPTGSASTRSVAFVAMFAPDRNRGDVRKEEVFEITEDDEVTIEPPGSCSNSSSPSPAAVRTQAVVDTMVDSDSD